MKESVAWIQTRRMSITVYLAGDAITTRHGVAGVWKTSFRSKPQARSSLRDPLMYGEEPAILRQPLLPL
jgi:hypothetical protein